MGKPGHGRSVWDGNWRHFVEHVQTTPGRLPVSLRREVFRLAGGRASGDDPDERTDHTEQAEVPEKLAAFAQDVAKRSQDVTDDQIAELRDAGYSEEQIFEAIVVAAVGGASTHLDAAHRAMEGT